MAAIGGLIFTGIATYYSAWVAQDQLEQSRDESVQKARDQASRVTFWEENSLYGKTREIHLVNRSPDPVSLIQVVIRVSGPVEDNRLLLADRNLPPCTEIAFNAADLIISPTAKDNSFLGDATWRIESLTFTDRNGRVWVRSPIFLSRKDQVQGFNDRVTGSALPSKPAEVKKVSLCGQGV
ncbi:hypothetical protein [Streptomyces zingiberis]|uniref:Uncharacterized protein n=1 Tax=Streptomyces zingiberis TaxID=2053010 RepID=A0ABX1BSG7_9ACTN|nr:hypothetical protein [Streptomyces zingiberis]NJP99350.1 hypothetical protein [Streptomyces zingiberis]